MSAFAPYLRLARLHQRTGVWLLLWPCWWSLALHANGLPPLEMLALFAIGAIVMRAAGCVINDIWDRKLDKSVERTKDRPLASGELTVAQAIGMLILLLAIAAGVAFALGRDVVIWSVASLPLVIFYPSMKRITYWPQLFLGFTFNWGALLGAVALTGAVPLSAVLLYLGGLFWTLGYDTLYAHQDRKDDILAGIKSSALALGDQTLPFVTGAYTMACTLWACAAWTADLAWPAMAGCAAMFIALLRQTLMSDLNNPASCGRAFRSNQWAGWLIFFGFLGAKFA